MSIGMFFAPAAVCVIGASSDPLRIGGRPVRYLLEGRFAGRILPVNPNRGEIQGLPAYPSLRSLPERPDLAIVALPREAVRAAVAECVALGIPAVTIFSSGFAETGEEGAALQRDIAALARGTGTRILGPNANGTMAPATGLLACFTPLLDRGHPQPGSTAIVTQSAALGTYLLDQCRQRGIGVALWAHTGNECDVTLLDMLAHAVERDDVRTVLLATEVLRDPARLRGILHRAAEREVGLAVLQVGSSEAGEAAAASHTGALVAAQSGVTRGLLRQGGAWLAGSLRELADIAEARAWIGAAAGSRVGVVTTSGGIGIMMADALDEAGLALPRLSDALQARLLAEAPFCHPGNPVDVTAQILNEPGRLQRVLHAIGSSGEVDLLVAFLPSGSARDPLTAQVLAAARDLAPAPVRLGAIGTLDAGAQALLHAAGVAVWHEPRDAGLALGAIAAPRRAPPPAPLPAAAPSEVARRLHRAAAAGTVGEIDSKQALRALGLPVVEDIVAATPAEAAAAARRLAVPVALKLHKPGLAHKAAAGGVRLGLADPAAVADAAAELLALPAAGDGAALLVEPMAEGIELFLGVSDSAEHGWLALCGLGGVDVERRRQVACRWLPVGLAEVREMLADSGVLAVLEATRRADAVQEIHRVLAALGGLLAESGGLLRAVEINPLMVGARGRCRIVDALVEVVQAGEA